MTATKQDIANLKTQLGTVNRHWQTVKDNSEKTRKGAPPGDLENALNKTMSLVLTRAADILRLRGLGKDPSEAHQQLEEHVGMIHQMYRWGGYTLEAQEAMKYTYAAHTIANSEHPISYEKAEAIAQQKMGQQLSWADAGDIEKSPLIKSSDSDRIMEAVRPLREGAMKCVRDSGASNDVIGLMEMSFEALRKIANGRLSDESLYGESAAALGRTELESAYSVLNRAKLRADTPEKKKALENCHDYLEAAEKVVKESTRDNILSAKQALKDVGGKHLHL